MVERYISYAMFFVVYCLFFFLCFRVVSVCVVFTVVLFGFFVVFFFLCLLFRGLFVPKSVKK